MISLNGRFLFCLLMAIVSGSAVAQPPAKEKAGLELSLGYGFIARQDLIFSPFIHQAGSPLNVGVAYQVPGTWTKVAAFRWSQYKPILGSAYSYTDRSRQQVMTQPHIFNLIDLRFAMGKTIYKRTQQELKVGGVFSTDIDALSFNYGFAGNSGYFGLFGLGLWSEGQYLLSKNQSVGFTFQLPVVAWITRSPYLANDDPYMKHNYSHNGVKTFIAYVGDGKLQTVNRFQKVNAAVQYTYFFKKRVGVGGKYELEFLHHALPLSLRSYQHVFSLTTTVKL
ncbi:MAG: hypothetical protein M3342_17185 [Bacteroidota bacterium]|nr:hypothetical protein [Bacteroidota bacterium]